MLAKAATPDELAAAHRERRARPVRRRGRSQQEGDEDDSEPATITAARSDPTCRRTNIMAIRRIGQILVDMGFIADDQLEMLLEEQQQQPGELLGKIAEEHGADHRRAAGPGAGRADGLQVINLAEAMIRPAYARPDHRARWPSCIASFRCDSATTTLTIAMCDPQNLAVPDELRTFLGYDDPPGRRHRAGHQARRWTATTRRRARASRASSASSKTTRSCSSRPRPWPATVRST